MEILILGELLWASLVIRDLCSLQKLDIEL